MINLLLNNETIDWNFTYTKKNGKHKHMVLVKGCWSFQTKVINIFLRSRWTLMTFSMSLWGWHIWVYGIIFSPNRWLEQSLIGFSMCMWYKLKMVGHCPVTSSYFLPCVYPSYRVYHYASRLESYMHKYVIHSNFRL